MNRGQLALIIAKNFNLELSKSEKIVDFIFAQIIQALKDGHRIYFRDFASFVKKIRPGRKYRHPKTGQIIMLPPRPYVDFTVSPALLKALGTKKKTTHRAIYRKRK